MRASWGLSRSWLPRVRSAGSLGVATRIPAPCLLGCRVFVLGVYVLLEPCDLVGEQTRRNLRCAAGDLCGGE